jgi:hypothetical protein
MADLITSLSHLSPPSISRLRLDRFSPYHQSAQEYGLEILGPLPYYSFIYPAKEASLNDLAYFFDYRHLDNRNPEIYARPLIDAVERWKQESLPGSRALTYRRGPGFITLFDSRKDIEDLQAGYNHTFGDIEAEIYLACDQGNSPTLISQSLNASGRQNVSPQDIRAFLDQLVALRLMYKEGDAYLSLAVAERNTAA